MRPLRILLFALFIATAAVMAGSLAATTAGAQEDDDEETDFSRTGTYASISGVYVSEQWPSSNKNAGADDSSGLNLRVGTRVNRWASAELEFEWIDDFFPDERQDFELITVSVNTRIYPFGGRVQPYALGGIGVAASIVDKRDRSSSISQSNADWQFRGGGGVDFYYSQHIAISFEAVYVATVGDLKDIDHLSIGLGALYRF